MSRRTRLLSRAVAACLLIGGMLCTVPRLPSAAAGQHLGIVTFSTSDVTTQAFVASTAKYAQQKGWSVQTVDANGSLTQANTAITDLAQKHVDAILVTVFLSKSLGKGLAAAMAANIPVLTAGGGLAPGIAMATDDGDAQPMVDFMLKQMNGQGKILELTYHPGLPCYERAVQFEATAKRYPGIKVSQHEISIPGAAETSKAATLAWLAANPAGPGNFSIYNCYDDNALGAIAALKQDGRTGVRVYSYNATPPALQAIQAGTMTATLYLDLPAAGHQLMDALPAIMKAGAKWKPLLVPTHYVIVTKQNLAAFEKAYPEDLKS